VKVYLSGPMTNIPEHNFPAFRAAAKTLRARGWTIISPAEMDETQPIENGTWGQYLARDLLVIAGENVDGMVFLPCWHNSRGARTEAVIGLNVRPDFCFFELDAFERPKNVSRKYVAKVAAGWSI
jgi:hypothetical protein